MDLSKESLKQFYADTRLSLVDMASELLAFSVLWHDMGYGNDAPHEIASPQPYMLAKPFAKKIRERLREDNRWPEKHNLEYIDLVTCMLMIKAASLKPSQVEAMNRELLYVAMGNHLFG